MDKHIFITGASTGIGASCAKQLAEDGWNVTLAARSEDTLEELAAEIGEDRAFPVVCDVTNYESLENATQKARACFGPLDAVLANAGTGGKPGGFTSAPRESWQQILNVNVLGLAYTLQAALSDIRARAGHVVITGSVAGRRYLDGSMYSVSKHAANAMAYNLRGELKGTGARVTLIEPGMVDTPFFDDPKPDALRPEDIARAVSYALAQPASVEVHDVLVLPTPKKD